jgi:putative SOS response-associated peptidase YedK
MPVVLPREHEKEWLSKDLDRGAIQSMLKPYSVGEMEAYTVPNVISKLGFNTVNQQVLNDYRYTDLPEIINGPIH